MMSLRNLAVAVVSSVGLSVAMYYEGLKLDAYRDEAGVPTICYGHTKGVKMGDRATKAQCDTWLREDMQWAQRDVRTLVKAPIGQNQFDALTIFDFNVGTANFASSTLLRKVNAGDCWGAANEFQRWSNLRDYKTKELRFSKGLYNRRTAERDLFAKDCV